jgi:hypothetical protein
MGAQQQKSGGGFLSKIKARPIVPDAAPTCSLRLVSVPQ